MARPLRIEYSGAVYHITSRENVRKLQIIWGFTILRLVR